MANNMSAQDPNEIANIFNAFSINTGYVKELALKRLHQTLSQQLDFLSTINHCKEYNSIEVKETPHSLFSWSYEEFLARRQLKSCEWIDGLTMKYSIKCLEKQKAKADLKEIQRFMELLFKVGHKMCNETCSTEDVEEMLWKSLRDAVSYNKMPQTLVSDHSKLISEYKEAQSRVLTMSASQGLDRQQTSLMALEDMVISSDVWYPIELRYATNWYNSKVNQIQYEKDAIHADYENDIERLKMKIIQEKHCGDSIMDCYYSLMEQYNHSIVELEERFNLELEEMENKNKYLRAQINGLNDAKQLHTEKIDQFHREIQQRLELEERRRAQAELKRQEEEAAALALLEAKKLKKQQKRKKGKAGAKKK
uniref:Uncharacterized protein n=1 Tax=Stomoxys calcitrans TaxID=35570 RepID=A0A1I8PSY1_STOCA